MPAEGWNAGKSKAEGIFLLNFEDMPRSRQKDPRHGVDRIKGLWYDSTLHYYGAKAVLHGNDAKTAAADPSGEPKGARTGTTFSKELTARHHGFPPPGGRLQDR